MNKLAFLYPWATVGGVERMLLNRAMALATTGGDLAADFIFTHDSGGAANLHMALAKIDSSARVLVYPLSELDVNYDLYICIDFPDAITKCDQAGLKYAVECHTAYKENRLYLQKLSSKCKFVAAPSRTFANEIRHEIPSEIPLITLENPVIRQPSRFESSLPPQIWQKIPILFLGRHDDLKNPTAILDLMVLDKINGNSDYFAIFCGPQWKEYNLTERADSRDVREKIVILPPIQFHSTQNLFALVKKSKGLFISPSSGESFGLAAAEAIVAGLPVILSNIPAHLALVSPFTEYFAYNLGDSEDLLSKANWISENYLAALKYIEILQKKILQDNFSQQWKDVLGYGNLQT